MWTLRTSFEDARFHPPELMALPWLTDCPGICAVNSCEVNQQAGLALGQSLTYQPQFISLDIYRAPPTTSLDQSQLLTCSSTSVALGTHHHLSSLPPFPSPSC